MTDTHKCGDDDPTEVKDEHYLRRRVSNIQWDGARVAQAAFDDPHCSVDLEIEIESEQSHVEFLGCAYPKSTKFENRESHGNKLLGKGWGVALVTPVSSRKNAQSVYKEPIQIPFKNKTINNKVHSLICGEKLDGLLFDLAEEATENIALRPSKPPEPSD